MTDPNDVTLASYHAGAERYLERTRALPTAMAAFLDRFAELVGCGRVLELGSGPGRDADYLELRGVDVSRTDATPAFVEHLRAAGHEARLLDLRTDELGGPYAGVMANAVLLHLSRPQFEEALGRVRQAVRAGGVLGLTLKEGDGEGWSHAKIGLPRHFTYWREPAVRDALARARWDVLALEHVAGPPGAWLQVLARAR